MKIRNMGLSFTLFPCIFFAIGGWMAHVQHRSLRNYKPTDASILSVGIKTGTDSDGRTTYAPQVRYQYAIDGQQHESDNVLPINVNFGRSWAEEIAYRFEPGQSVMAYYNPAKPGEAFLVHEASFFPYLFILVPMIFTCVGLMLMFNDATPGTRKFTLRGPPVVSTFVWNVAGVAVAVHYFSVADHVDLTAAVAFMLYGLVGAILIYTTVQMKRDRADAYAPGMRDRSL
jgi:hypothetical protein